MIFKNLTGYVCPVLKPIGNRIPLALSEYMAMHSKLILEDAIYLQHTPHGSTIWQTQWSSEKPSHPHQIVIDMGKDVKGISKN